MDTLIAPPAPHAGAPARQSITVLGLDPSFANFGMVRATIDIVTQAVVITDMRLCQTEKDDNKQVRASSDRVRRARESAEVLDQMGKGVSFAFAEVPHGSQSAISALGAGVCIGLLASFSRTVPLIEMSEQEVKLGSHGMKNATKRQVIEWAYGMHPDAPGWHFDRAKLKKGERHLPQHNEHLADAIAAIHAGIKTQEFQRLRSSLKSLMGI